MQGYLHPRYAHSFSEFGEPTFLPRAKGWLIRRAIPGTSLFDAMGPYPLFFCENWEHLSEDLLAFSETLVSISFVVDPFGFQNGAAYFHNFDVFNPFKDHYILDTTQPFSKSISKNKQKNAKHALKQLEVHLEIAPRIDLNSWVRLYDHLIERHQIKGLRAFSRSSFEDQISIPNTHCFWVTFEGEVVGGNLFYIQDDVAYAHLSAFSPKGYDLGAPYAVKWIAIQHLAEIVRYINFGGAPSQEQNSKDGLSLFKQGWSTEIRKSYFCGKILNPLIYQTLSLNHPTKSTWFPAYRAGEYGT